MKFFQHTQLVAVFLSFAVAVIPYLQLMKRYCTSCYICMCEDVPVGVLIEYT